MDAKRRSGVGIQVTHRTQEIVEEISSDGPSFCRVGDMGSHSKATLIKVPKLNPWGRHGSETHRSRFKKENASHLEPIDWNGFETALPSGVQNQLLPSTNEAPH